VFDFENLINCGLAVVDEKGNEHAPGRIIGIVTASYAQTGLDSRIAKEGLQLVLPSEMLDD
jgi:hypothetical protein